MLLGTITDKTGASLSGAQVTAVNIGTNFTRTPQSNNQRRVPYGIHAHWRIQRRSQRQEV
jgi:hypothetical protein